MEDEYRYIAVVDLERIRQHLLEMEGFYFTHFSNTVFDRELVEAGKRVFGWGENEVHTR